MKNSEILEPEDVATPAAMKNRDEENGYAVPVKRRSALLTTIMLAYESIGVVYGDLGTSPLYVYNTTFVFGVEKVEDVIGVTSLIMWLLILSPLVKYCFVVLTCDDNGEGGTFAAYGLLARNLGISRVHGGRTSYEQTLSQYTIEQNPTRSDVADSVKKAFQGSMFLQNTLLFLALLATCMLIGDGVLTPAQSVLSAIGGINNNTSLNQDVVVGISCGGLFLFYCVQHYGTSKIGFCFAPIIIAFLLIVACVGIWNIARYNAWFVFKAFSPHYGIDFLIRNGMGGWIMLGGVFLTVTGTEAMYADLGHFSDKDKQVSAATVFKLAFACFILPCLVLGYLGQAAWLTQADNMPNVSAIFFLSIPQTPAIYWPIFVIATAAAAVASQSIVTATFTIVHQAMALGCFPQMTVRHTSSKAAGQIYIPEVNFVLAVLTILITAVMGRDGTTTIGNAFGIAVSGVMIITTLLVTLLLITVKRKSILLWLPFLVFFFCAEAVFLSANLYKVPQGGWVPLAFAGVFLFIMFVWHYGSGKEYECQVESKLSHDWLMSSSIQAMGRVPGLALFYSDLDNGIPPIFSHFLASVSSVHSVVVFIAVKRVEVPTVLVAERFAIKRIGPSDAHVFRCLVRYGYKEVTSEQSGALAEELVKALVDHIRTEEDTSTIYDFKAANGEEEQEAEGQIGAARQATKEEEVKLVVAAKEAGVKHILGRITLKAQVDRTWQSIFKRFVIDYAYRGMKVNTRDPASDLGVPNNTLEVGMKVFV